MGVPSVTIAEGVIIMKPQDPKAALPVQEGRHQHTNLVQVRTAVKFVTQGHTPRRAAEIALVIPSGLSLAMDLVHQHFVPKVNMLVLMLLYVLFVQFHLTRTRQVWQSALHASVEDLPQTQDQLLHNNACPPLAISLRP